MASANDLQKELMAAVGGNDEEATVKIWLDSGFPPLSMASSNSWDGTFPVGRMIEVAGPPSAGKTALATNAMAAAQDMGGIAGFMDHERSFSFLLGEKLGLDTKKRFVYKKPRTFEESIAIFNVAVDTIRTKKLIPADAPICWVWDSLASMVPQSVLFDKDGKPRSAETRNMNDNTALARATSAHFPAIAMICEHYNVCGIFLNQMRKDLNVKFGDPRKTTGGDSPEFYFSQRLWLSAAQITKGEGKKKEILGSEVTGNFKKNKVNRPFKTASWRFMFQEDGSGRFDAERSLVEFLNDTGAFPETDSKTNKAVRPGFVLWEDKQISREALARQIQAEGPAGMKKLKALLPPAYEPPISMEVDVEDNDNDNAAAA